MKTILILVALALPLLGCAANATDRPGRDPAPTGSGAFDGAYGGLGGGLGSLGTR